MSQYGLYCSSVRSGTAIVSMDSIVITAVRSGGVLYVSVWILLLS